MKIFLVLILTFLNLFSLELNSAIKTYKASGSVVDLVQKENLLYASTDVGIVNIFDIKTGKIVRNIKVKKIKDFMGDEVESKIFSVDILENKILILSQSEQGFRRLYIETDKKKELIIDTSASLAIAKAKFINKNTVLLALLSNELISYNIKTKKQNWKIQVSGARFSNFVLNENRDKVIVADESGDLKEHSTKNGKLIKKFEGKNLDNVFQVDTKNGVIATAGQDRRVVIYTPVTVYYKKSTFLVYSVGLSASGNRVAYSSDEKNNVTVFDTNTRDELGTFGKNKMIITNIVFMNENEFFVSSDDSLINLYEIK